MVVSVKPYEPERGRTSAPAVLCELETLEAACTGDLMPRNHLPKTSQSRKNTAGRHTERGHTVLVRVLKTRTCPVEVPMKTCFPEGSKRATVMTELHDASVYCMGKKV